MKISRNEDKSILFSCTDISDIFFTEYLPSIPGNYLKVYLYILFLSKYHKDVKLNDLSKILNLPFPEIQEAFTFLEDQKLLTKLPDGYKISDIQELELSNLYSPKVTSTPEDIKQNIQNKERSKAIDYINNQFFQGVMSPAWYNDIDFWFNKYGFSQEVMIALFNYAYENKALTRNYLQTVADAWHINNIVTFDDLEAYEQNKEKFNKLKKTITKKLGMKRNLTSYEEEYLVKWTEEFGYGLDIIELALKRSSNLTTINFSYFDKILSDWNEKELRTPEQVEAYSASSKEKDKKPKEYEKKTLPFNYVQNTFDSFEDLYDN
jgi:DnaD/phage-associated family protein